MSNDEVQTRGRIAVLVSQGVEDVLPAGDAGLAGTDEALRLYELLRPEIIEFDRAVRRRLAQIEKRQKPVAVTVT